MLHDLLTFLGQVPLVVSAGSVDLCSLRQSTGYFRTTFIFIRVYDHRWTMHDDQSNADNWMPRAALDWTSTQQQTLPAWAPITLCRPLHPIFKGVHAPLHPMPGGSFHAPAMGEQLTCMQMNGNRSLLFATFSALLCFRVPALRQIYLSSIPSGNRAEPRSKMAFPGGGPFDFSALQSALNVSALSLHARGPCKIRALRHL